MTDSLNNAQPHNGTRATDESRNDPASDKPIDTSQLFKRCMGNIDFAKSLLAELESSGNERIDDIKRLAATADCQATADAAHALKGTAAILGAEPLQRLAAEIEALSRAGLDTQLHELTNQLAVEMKRCLEFIPTINDDTAER